MSNYILSYNPLATTPSAGQVLNHIRINKFIDSYHEPFPGTYLLKSVQPPHILNESFKGFFESNSFLLTYTQSNFVSGMMSPEAWQWMNYGILPNFPPTTNIGAGVTDALRALGQNKP